MREEAVDFAAINAFVTVGNTGGFRAAAKVLGMTPAGVSKAVARLEARIGVTLLARTTRCVRLTSAGGPFHARCKTILADLEAAADEAGGAVALARGRLCLSLTRAFGRARIVPVITEFARQYPQVEITARFSDRFADLVAEGVDVAVRVGDLPDSGLLATQIGRTRFMMCATPEYLRLHGRPCHPDDLRRHRVLGYASPGSNVRFTHRFLIDGETRKMDLTSQIIMDDADALVAAGLRSAGLVMANDYMLERQISDGRLIPVLQEFEPPSMPISVLQLPSRNPSPAAKAFVVMLRRRLATVGGQPEARGHPEAS